MKSLRNLYRGALDHELGVLGEQVESALQRLEDGYIQLEALRERIDRRMNTLGMRTARAAASGGSKATAAEVAAALAHTGSDGAQDTSNWAKDLDRALRGPGAH